MLQLALNPSDRARRSLNKILTLERLKMGKVQLGLEQGQIIDRMLLISVNKVE